MDHQYRTYVKFKMKIQSSDDVQGSVVWKMGDILVKMQENDSDFAFIKARDDEVVTHSRQQMPRELEDQRTNECTLQGGTKILEITFRPANHKPSKAPST